MVLAFDLVELGWFQAARGGWDRYSGPFDINSALILPCRGQIRHDCDTILIFVLDVSTHFLLFLFGDLVFVPWGSIPGPVEGLLRGFWTP